MTILIVLVLLNIAVYTTKAVASHWPVSAAARSWKPDRHWLSGAFCIHNHESVDWHLAGRDYRGHSSPYYGGMQFLISTWRTAGGTGLPSDWAPREQLYRAFVIWRMDGGSFREWGTASACGLH